MLALGLYVLIPDAAFGAAPAVTVPCRMRVLVEEIGVPVRVKIQQHAALLQHPRPLGIRPIGVRQIPGQIAADDRVEALVREGERLGVHFHKTYLVGQRAGVFFCLGEHGAGEVDGRHGAAQLAQQDGEEARPGADLQHLQAGKRTIGEPPRQLLTYAALPSLPLRRGQLQPVDLRIAGSTVGPVIFILFKDRVSAHHNSPSGLSQ